MLIITVIHFRVVFFPPLFCNTLINHSATIKTCWDFAQELTVLLYNNEVIFLYVAQYNIYEHYSTKHWAVYNKKLYQWIFRIFRINIGKFAQLCAIKSLCTLMRPLTEIGILYTLQSETRMLWLWYNFHTQPDNFIKCEWKKSYKSQFPNAQRTH